MGLFLSHRRGKEAWLYLLHTGLSFLFVLLPFLLYFLYTHTLGDFLSVYFSFVSKTYQSGEPISLLSRIKSLIFNYCLNIYALPLWLALACLLPYSPLAASSPLRDKPSIRLWLIVFIMATFIAGSPYLWTNMGFLYYTYIFVPVSIVVTLGMAAAVRKAVSPLALGTLGCVALVFSIQLNRTGEGKECVFSPHHRGDLLMEQELLSKDNPKVLYLGTLEQGYGIAAHALPAVPCWSGLNKPTEEFKEMQAQAVRERKADYVFCRYLAKGSMLKTNAHEFEAQEKFIKYRELLEASGYELLYLTENPTSVTGMWRRK